MPTTKPEILPAHQAVVNELWRVVYVETKKDRGPTNALYDFCVAFGTILQRMDMPHAAIRPVADELMKIRAILRSDWHSQTACVILTSVIEKLHVRLHTKTSIPTGP